MAQAQTINLRIVKITRTWASPTQIDLVELYVYCDPKPDRASFSVIAPDGIEYSLGTGGLASTQNEPSFGHKLGFYPLTEPGVCTFKVVVEKSGYLSAMDTETVELVSLAQYQSLNTSYTSLKTSYDVLRSTYESIDRALDQARGELNNYRLLSNMFMGTTLIFIVISILTSILYLRARVPK